MPQRHFAGIDIARFTAALLVAIFHLGYWVQFSPDTLTGRIFANATSFPEIHGFASGGWVGVEIFFVISGFVIAHSAQHSTAAQFAFGRAMRLYPAVWICAPLAAAIILLMTDTTLAELSRRLLASLALWPKGPWIDGVYWTLPVEMAFYGLVGLLLVFRAFQRLELLAAILTIISASFLIFDQLVPADPPYLFTAPRILLLRYGCFFALGVWMWKTTTKEPLMFRYLPFVAFLACCGEIIATGRYEARFVVPLLLWIAAMIFVWRTTRVTSSFMSTAEWGRSVTRSFGLATYPMYLLHYPLGVAIVRLLVESGMNRWLSLICSLLFVIAISLVIALVFEHELRKAIRSALAQWKLRPASTG